MARLPDAIRKLDINLVGLAFGVPPKMRPATHKHSARIAARSPLLPRAKTGAAAADVRATENSPCS